MRSLETEIAIGGTPEQVWSVLTDFGHYADWNPFIRRVTGEARKGTKLRVEIHPPDARPMTFTPTIREAVAARELRWLGHLWLPGLLDGEHVFRIDRAGDGHVSFRQDERFRGILVPLLPSATYESIRRGFEAMNEALKARVETLHG